jgi:hypothetical protein
VAVATGNGHYVGESEEGVTPQLFYFQKPNYGLTRMALR